MKKFKASIKLKTLSHSIETVVTANSSSDAKKLIEGQYGSNLQSVNLTEIR